MRLYQKYNLFNKLNKKFFNQYVDLFLIKKKVDQLIYELNLFFTFKVYSIIFVTQLKSTDIFKDFYQRSKSDYSSSINTKNQKKKIFDIRLRK